MNAASFQTLPEKLLKFYPGTPDDLQRLLRDELYRSHPDANERDSIRKKRPQLVHRRKGHRRSHDITPICA